MQHQSMMSCEEDAVKQWILDGVQRRQEQLLRWWAPLRLAKRALVQDTGPVQVEDEPRPPSPSHSSSKDVKDEAAAEMDKKKPQTAEGQQGLRQVPAKARPVQRPSVPSDAAAQEDEKKPDAAEKDPKQARTVAAKARPAILSSSSRVKMENEAAAEDGLEENNDERPPPPSSSNEAPHVPSIRPGGRTRSQSQEMRAATGIYLFIWFLCQ